MNVDSQNNQNKTGCTSLKVTNFKKRSFKLKQMYKLFKSDA